MTGSPKTFTIGLIAGTVLTLAIVFMVKVGGFSPGASENILAEVDGKTYTREEARQDQYQQLIPSITDEYAILKKAAEQWVESALIRREADARRLSENDLIAQEVWGKVQVSKEDILESYKQDDALHKKSFKEVEPLLRKILRQREHDRIHRQWIQKLKKKYNAKVHLKLPKGYLKNLVAPAGGLKDIPAQKKETAKNYWDSEKAPSKGPANAPVTIVEFSDFHCPFCGKVNPTLARVMKEYKNKVRIVWRDYPLSFHKGAEKTHEAAKCAHAQGKFWEYHDALFAQIGGYKTEEARIALAEKLGLNKRKFTACIQSGKFASEVKQEIAQGKEAGVRGTPGFFINGRSLSGAQPYAKFKEAIEVALDPSKAKPEEAKRPVAKKQPAAIVSFNDLKGRPSKGPANAPVTLVEFSDFHCPFCKRVSPTLLQLEKNFPGKIRRVWRHYPLPFHKGADKTHEASECAHAQGKFWEYKEKLFEGVGTYKDNDSRIKLAESLGLDKKKFTACLESGKFAEVVKKDTKKGAESGVRGTPAVFINGKMVSGARPYDDFKQEIEAALDPTKKVVKKAPQKAPPKNVKFNDLKGKPSKGPAKAPVTIVEFSDFHCPFCGRVIPTLEKVMKEYKDKVRLVWRDYPLPFHKGADKTHEAAKCAHAQGKFWEYHDALFAQVGGYKSEEAKIALAEKVGLNKKKFSACLESGKYASEVKQEAARGKEAGVRGTPAFFINGKLLSGAKPYADFKEAIDEALKKA